MYLKHGLKLQRASITWAVFCDPLTIEECAYVTLLCVKLNNVSYKISGMLHEIRCILELHYKIFELFLGAAISFFMYLHLSFCFVTVGLFSFSSKFIVCMFMIISGYFVIYEMNTEDTAEPEKPEIRLKI